MPAMPAMTRTAEACLPNSRIISEGSLFPETTKQSPCFSLCLSDDQAEKARNEIPAQREKEGIKEAGQRE